MESHSPTSDRSGDFAGEDLAGGSLRAGAVLRSRYVLEEVIGRGGHSVVFRAKDLHRVTAEDSSGGHIALKALHPSLRANEAAIACLGREFQQMQMLAHPGIARVFDLDCDGDIWFLTMELVVGRTVSDWMRTPVALVDAMHVIAACCEALDYAHSMGVVHGDLKPSNVLLTPNGRVKLIDFGSVPTRGTGTDEEKKPNASAIATPSFASPQVLAGMRAEARDDIFSLACLSYGILSEGARPFGDKSSLEAHRARLCPAAIPGMPVEVFAVLARSLAGDRELRPVSARVFHQELVGSTIEESQRDEQTFGTSRKVNARGLGRVSIASLAVGVICAAALMLPAARKIVAGTHEAAPVAVQAPVVAAETPAPVSEQQAPLPAETTDVASAPAVHSAGIIGFEVPAIVAGSAQSLLAIPLKRMLSTHGSASVEWEIESGSAMPNVDYQPVKPQLVKFNDGEAVRSLFIPLIRTGGNSDAQPPRTFAVLLRRVGGGVKLGPVTRINVTIVPQPIYSDISNAVAISRFPAN